MTKRMRPKNSKSPVFRAHKEMPLEHVQPSEAKDRLHSLLYEALETEQGGVLVYEAALKCAIHDDLADEWQKYHQETMNHVDILGNVIKKLGMNPDQDTPGRNIVRHSAMGLVRTMDIALMAGKPDAAQIVAAECVLLAETKDHLNWQLIGAAAQSAFGAERDVLQKAYHEVEDEEDEQLYHSKAWARELHLQALGLPAQLPPLEGKEDVKTEMDEARVVNRRKQALANNGKRGSNEKTTGQEGSRVRRSGTVKSKGQNRRSAA